MNLFSAKPLETSPSAPAATPVVLLRGDYFFVRRLELPAGTGPDEVAGFVDLKLEELAPFPLEQLFHGHVRASDGSAVVVYAAYRRRFSSEETERWQRTTHVMPEFAATLRMKFEVATMVLLRSDSALTAMYFEANRELPLRVASRPLAVDASPSVVEKVRHKLAELVEAGSARELTLKLRQPPEQRSKGLGFVFEPDAVGAVREVFVPADECWAMDVRDPEFVAQQRKRLGFDLLLWRIVQGSAAVLALLLLGEVMLLGARGYVALVENRIESRAAEVQSLRDKDDVAGRLDEFSRSGVQPFRMLDEAASVMPDTVQFTRAVARGHTTLEVEGIAPNVAVVNAYESALRGVASVNGVQIVRNQPRADGTSFVISVTFQDNAFTRNVEPPGALAQGDAAP